MWVIFEQNLGEKIDNIYLESLILSFRNSEEIKNGVQLPFGRLNIFIRFIKSKNLAHEKMKNKYIRIFFRIESPLKLFHPKDFIQDLHLYALSE